MLTLSRVDRSSADRTAVVRRFRVDQTAVLLCVTCCLDLSRTNPEKRSYRLNVDRKRAKITTIVGTCVRVSRFQVSPPFANEARVDHKEDEKFETPSIKSRSFHLTASSHKSSENNALGRSTAPMSGGANCVDIAAPDWWTEVLTTCRVRFSEEDFHAQEVPRRSDRKHGKGKLRARPRHGLVRCSQHPGCRSRRRQSRRPREGN